MDLVYSVPIVTQKTFVTGFPLKITAIFLDLVCSVHIFTLKTGVNFSNKISYIQHQRGPFSVMELMHKGVTHKLITGNMANKS